MTPEQRAARARGHTPECATTGDCCLDWVTAVAEGAPSVRCDGCNGRGATPSGNDSWGIHCLSCSGTGRLPVPERQSMVLEQALDDVVQMDLQLARAENASWHRPSDLVLRWAAMGLRAERTDATPSEPTDQQDAADGKALRELKDACKPDGILDLTWAEYNQPGSWNAWIKHPKSPDGSFSGKGATVAEACDAARKALVSK